MTHDSRALNVVFKFACLATLMVFSTGCDALIPQRTEDRMIQREVLDHVKSLRTDLFEDGNLHVIVIGSGTPQPGTGRLPQSTAVIAGKRFIVVDAGEGAGRAMADRFLPIDRITDVLITHFHSDHIGGLGQLLNQSWNAGRTNQVDLWGPEGLDSIMKGFAEVYAPDISYRSADLVEHNDPALALADVHTFAMPEGENSWLVDDSDGVRITAFRVDHGHVHPAVGYKIEYRGLSLVFSGDTVASPLLLEPARNADLLIHEAINVRMMENAAIGLEKAGLPVEADRARGVVKYHADTLGVAEIAQQAGVKHLVLSHLIPAPPNRIAESIFVEGMSDRYKGKITVARDGSEFTLKP